MIKWISPDSERTINSGFMFVLIGTEFDGEECSKIQGCKKYLFIKYTLAQSSGEGRRG